MYIGTAISNIEKMREQLPAILLDVTIEAASDAKAIIQDRVQTTGQTASRGSKFLMTPYSESYREYRESKGRQTKFVDLTFTGSMWQGIGVTNAVSNGVEANVEIGGQNADAIGKLVDLERQKGFSLELTDIELENIEESFEKELDERLTKLVSPEMRVL